MSSVVVHTPHTPHFCLFENEEKRQQADILKRTFRSWFSEVVAKFSEVAHSVHSVAIFSSIELNVQEILRNVAAECTTFWMYKKFYWMLLLNILYSECTRNTSECTTKCRYWMYYIVNVQEILLHSVPSILLNVLNELQNALLSTLLNVQEILLNVATECTTFWIHRTYYWMYYILNAQDILQNVLNELQNALLSISACGVFSSFSNKEKWCVL